MLPNTTIVFTILKDAKRATKHKMCMTALPLLTLPETVQIRHITQLKQLISFVEKTVSRDCVIALDTEWTCVGGTTVVSILQIACRGWGVVLVDFLSLIFNGERDEDEKGGESGDEEEEDKSSIGNKKEEVVSVVNECIEKLLKAKTVRKIGWRFGRGDLSVLVNSGLCKECMVERYVEASKWLPSPRGRERGLADVVAEVLQVRLDKEECQRGQWGARPLPERMVNYAASDAWVLLELADALSRREDSAEGLWREESLILEEVKGRSKKKPSRAGVDLSTSEEKQFAAEKEARRLKKAEEKRKNFIRRFACKKKVYDNCVIISKKGQHLAFCDRKKANWYLNKGLATLEPTSDDTMTVRLVFEPKDRLGDEFDPVECRAPRFNRCVSCSHSTHYTRFHIVPVAYRKRMPISMKSHRNHDVVLLCIDCHEKANIYVAELKKQIAEEFDAPITGIGTKGLTDEERKLFKAARTLDNPTLKDRIPQWRRAQLQEFILEGLGVEKDVEFTREHLEEALNLEARKRNSGDLKCRRFSHGRIVMSRLMESENKQESLHQFIRRWRVWFLEKMQPSHLPEDWSVDYATKLDTCNFFLSDAGYHAYRQAVEGKRQGEKVAVLC